MSSFLLAVLSLPGVFDGEADRMEALLAAGLERLHLRKPGASLEVLEALLQRLAPRWAERLVLHGPHSRELALRYGVPSVHGAVAYKDGRGYSGGGPMVTGDGLAVSTSVHGWDEFSRLPGGLAYAFISPLFDSISKQGYRANAVLLKRPVLELPCPAIGLGGVSSATIGLLLEHGWAGAAVLGWIWEEPLMVVDRFTELQKMVENGST